MQRWFDSPAWAMPEAWKKRGTQPHPLHLKPAHYDENIVKMEWAMKFERCRQAVALAESRITAENSRERLTELLKKSGWKGDGVGTLGAISMSSMQIDAFSQINIAKFGNAWDVLDDMYGALGAATVKVGVVGQAVRKVNSITRKTSYFFHIDYLGFYIRDHYDFVGPQYLGTWTESRVLTKAQTLYSMTPHGDAILRLEDQPFAAVDNKHFREYRSKTGKGGDFIIYSDVLWKKVDHTIDLGIWV